MFTVYKVTNSLNNKTYIGVHETDNPNDDYLGSGIAIKNAIEKHGRHNFTKEILLETEFKEEAYRLEYDLTEDFNLNTNYNMKRGGVGGFTKEAAIKGHKSRSRLGGKKAAELKVGMFSSQSENGRKGGMTNKGRKLSEEHKEKIKQSVLRRIAQRSSASRS